MRLSMVTVFTSTLDILRMRLMLLTCGIGEDSWESLGLQGIKPVNSKENQSWILTGRTNAEAQVPISRQPDMKSWLIRKDSDAGKDWRQKKKGTTEDEKVRWHRWLNGHEFEQALGDGEGQGSLVCCSPWGHKGSDMTEQLNNKATTQLTASLGKSHNRIFTRRDRIRTRHVNG